MVIKASTSLVIVQLVKELTYLQEKRKKRRNVSLNIYTYQIKKRENNNKRHKFIDQSVSCFCS